LLDGTPVVDDERRPEGADGERMMNADSSRPPPPAPPLLLVLVVLLALLALLVLSPLPYPTTPAPALTTPPTPFLTAPPTPAKAEVRLRVDERRYATPDNGEGPGRAEDDVLTRGAGVDGETGFDTDTTLRPWRCAAPVVSIGCRDGLGAEEEEGPFTVKTLLAIGSSSSLDVVPLSP
jgi:hypothetical protein